MTYLIVKFVVSGVVVVAVSEIAKRSSVFGGLIAALPLTSVLAMTWLYRDTHDTERIASLATSIFWLVLPSLVLFVMLAALLKRQFSFYNALGVSTATMLACYAVMVFVLKELGIKL